MAVESVSLKTVELLDNKVLGYFGISNTFLDRNIHAPFGFLRREYLIHFLIIRSKCWAKRASPRTSMIWEWKKKT